MSYSEFRGGLQSFNEYIATERIDLVGETALFGNPLLGGIRAEISGNMKDMICQLLAGNLNLPQVQICMDANLSALIGSTGLPAALSTALTGARTAMQTFMDHTGIDAALGRLNAVMGEIASVASMINFCATPINAKPIPNLLENVMGSFLGEGDDLMALLGGVIPDQLEVCYNPATGKVNHNAFPSTGLLAQIQAKIDYIGSGAWAAQDYEDFVTSLDQFSSETNNLIASELAISTASTEADGLGSANITSTATGDPPALVSFVPNKDSSDNYRDLKFTVVFSQPMNTATVTIRTAAGSSNGGNILVSTDSAFGDHTLEVVMSDVGVIASSQNTTFQFSPAINLSANTTYYVKVTSGVTNSFETGVAMAVTYGNHSFHVGSSTQTPTYAVGTGQTNSDIGTVINRAINLRATHDSLGGYPVCGKTGSTQEGVCVDSIFDKLLPSQITGLLATGDNYSALVQEKIPIYDYCGNIVGYTTVTSQGEQIVQEGTELTAPDTYITIREQQAIGQPEELALDTEAGTAVSTTTTQTTTTTTGGGTTGGTGGGSGTTTGGGGTGGTGGTSGTTTSAEYTSVVQTIDATSTIATFTVNNIATEIGPALNTSWFFTIRVAARRVGLISEQKAWEFRNVINNFSGNLTLVGDNVEHTFQHQASTTNDDLGNASTGTTAWDVGITAYSATNVLRITITGEVNKRINWSIAVDYVQIPSDVTL